MSEPKPANLRQRWAGLGVPGHVIDKHLAAAERARTGERARAWRRALRDDGSWAWASRRARQLASSPEHRNFKSERMFLEMSEWCRQQWEQQYRNAQQ